MTPSEILEAAAGYLAFVVHGTADARARALFPDLPSASGMRLRQPATRGDAPDYAEPPVDEMDGQIFEAGDVRGPSDAPFVFVDRCALHDVRTQTSGKKLKVEFIAISDYPGPEFPVELAVPTAVLARCRVVLPTALGEHFAAAEECLDRLQDFLGDQLAEIDIEHTVTLISFEELQP